MRKAILFIAALASATSAAGCRRVVILNFNGPKLTEEVDRLFVEGVVPRKDQRELSGLQQTVGYYDVSTTKITVRVTACSGSDLLAYQQGEYDVRDDEVTIPIEPAVNLDLVSQFSPPPCRPELARTDGGSGDSEAGGGSGGEGGAAGTGGVAGTGDGGGAGGNAGADSGAGGLNGCGGLDGGGQGGAIDAGTCDPPTGAPVVPTVTTLNPACTNYCNDMANACPGTYTDVTQCQRYCTLAGWPAGGSNTDRDDTIACRDAFAAMAAIMSPDNRPSKCAIAGPSGGPGYDCGQQSGPCGRFCQAWAGVCGGDAQACSTACAALPAAAVTCRFPWLLAASGDSNYCPLVDLTTGASACRPPGC